MPNTLKFADEVIVDGVREDGNMVLATLAGLAAGTAGALLWVGFTGLTGEQITWFALPVAALVGLSVRFIGAGVTPLFGVVGGLFTLLGSFTGQVLSEIMSGISRKYDFYGVLTHIDLNQLITSLFQQTTATTYVIYAVAIIGAYRVSMQKPKRL